jgi:dihydroxy-acid dehydratase
MTPPDHLVRKASVCCHAWRRPAERHIGQPIHLERVTRIGRGRNSAILQTGDKVKVDLKSRRVDVLLSDEEIARRRQNLKPPPITNNSPWQELYRANVGQLSTGACLDFAVPYRDLRKVVPRHSH